jgi:hypothetical protein
VIDLDTSLGQEFFDIAVGWAVAQVLADRHHDRFWREPESGERRTRRQRDSTTGAALHRLILADQPPADATDPIVRLNTFRVSDLPGGPSWGHDRGVREDA